MNRRQFLSQSAILAAGINHLYDIPDFSPMQIPPEPIRTLEGIFRGNTIRIHAIPTGTVKVKKSHKNAGLGLAQILLDFRWTDPLPIYCWLLEHPEGLILVDTGENSKVLEKDYFACDATTGWVNKKILDFDIDRSREIDSRLTELGFRPDEVRWVVLTHMHIDHVDGLHHFSKSEILFSRTEYQNPFGSVPCLLPNWLKPRLIVHKDTDPHFPGKWNLTQDGCVRLVPTPGHSHGHQSVIVELDNLSIFIAGDASFSEKQMLENTVAGICVDGKKARETYQSIQKFVENRPTIYLPSHDTESGTRLEQRKVLKR